MPATDSQSQESELFNRLIDIRDECLDMATVHRINALIMDRRGHHDYPLLMTRAEYIGLLKDANDEGRVVRSLNGAIESKEQWEATNYWETYPKDMREEFYRAYRAGYLAMDALIKAKPVTK
jgi:hypothetical protein